MCAEKLPGNGSPTPQANASLHCNPDLSRFQPPRHAAHQGRGAPWRQPRGKPIVSLVNSHTNATSKRWHLWEIDLRFAPGLPPGWLRGGITSWALSRCALRPPSILLSSNRRSFEPPPFGDLTKSSCAPAKACTERNIQHMRHHHQRLNTPCF